MVFGVTHDVRTVPAPGPALEFNGPEGCADIRGRAIARRVARECILIVRVQ